MTKTTHVPAKPAPAVLLVAADASGRPQRILRQISRGGAILS